jgi:hypothetical protein
VLVLERSFARRQRQAPVTVPLNQAKTLAAVLLPTIGALANGTPALHVFALAVS